MYMTWISKETIALLKHTLGEILYKDGKDPTPYFEYTEQVYVAQADTWGLADLYDDLGVIALDDS